MNKDKLLSLQNYLQNLNNRLTSPVPEKHKNHPNTLKEFLKREIEATNKKIESAKLEGTK